MPFGEPEEDSRFRRLGAIVAAIGGQDLQNRQMQMELARQKRERDMAAAALEPYQTAMAGPPSTGTGRAKYSAPGALQGSGAVQSSYPNPTEQKNLAMQAVLNLSAQGTQAARESIGNLVAAKAFMPEDVKRPGTFTSGNPVWNPDKQQYEIIGPHYYPQQRAQFRPVLKKDEHGQTVFQEIEGTGKKAPVYELKNMSTGEVIGETLGTAVGPPAGGDKDPNNPVLKEIAPYTLPNGSVQSKAYSGHPDELVNQLERRLKEIDDTMTKHGGGAEASTGLLGINWKILGAHPGWDSFKAAMEQNPYREDVKTEDFNDSNVKNYADEYIGLKRKVADLKAEWGLEPAVEPKEAQNRGAEAGEGTASEESSGNEEPETTSQPKANKTSTGKRYTIKIK